MNWDIFICHASEDKDAVVRPLAAALRALGAHVWFDEFALKVGDRLSKSIDQGLAQSRFGVVVLSPSFLEKRWPEYELSGLTAREQAGESVILPVWHNITAAVVRAFSPPLANKIGLDTSRLSVSEIARRIWDRARPPHTVQRTVTLCVSFRKLTFLQEQAVEPEHFAVWFAELERLSQEIVRLVRGTLEPFSREGLVVHFADDECQRTYGKGGVEIAMRCACDLIRAFDIHHSALRPLLHLHTHRGGLGCAIAVGDAVWTVSSRGHPLIFGHAVTAAGRLSDRVATGRIVLTNPAFQALPADAQRRCRISHESSVGEFGRITVWEIEDAPDVADPDNRSC